MYPILALILLCSGACPNDTFPVTQRTERSDQFVITQREAPGVGLFRNAVFRVEGKHHDRLVRLADYPRDDFRIEPATRKAARCCPDCICPQGKCPCKYPGQCLVERNGGRPYTVRHCDENGRHCSQKTYYPPGYSPAKVRVSDDDDGDCEDCPTCSAHRGGGCESCSSGEGGGGYGLFGLRDRPFRPIRNLIKARPLRRAFGRLFGRRGGGGGGGGGGGCSSCD